MPDPESERKTRKARIDPRLRQAGWDPAPLVPGSSYADYHRQAVEEFPTGEGPADYALCADLAIMAFVEAKLATGPQNVLTQAERYSRSAHSNAMRIGDARVSYGDY